MLRRLLLVSSLSMLAILLYFYGSEIFKDLSKNTPKLEEVLPAHVTESAPIAPAIGAGLEHQIKSNAMSPKKQPVQGKSLKANQVNHPIKATKPVAVNKSYQPEVKAIENVPAPKPANRWIKSISGQGVRVNFRKTEPLPEDCAAHDCSEKREGYTVAGVVVKSDRLDSDLPLIDGEVGVGDAQEKPLVHLK